MRLRLLLVVQPLGVLVEQTVVVEQRSAHPVELVDDSCVLVVHPLHLARELRLRLPGRRELGLRGPLLLGRAEPFELSPKGGRRALRLAARGRLLLEQRPLLLHDPLRLFGRAEIGARERLHLGQPLANRAPSGTDRRGVDRNRSERQHRRGRERSPFAFGEHLVEEQLARTTGLGSAEVGRRVGVRRRYGHPSGTSASDGVTLDATRRVRPRFFRALRPQALRPHARGAGGGIRPRGRR